MSVADAGLAAQALEEQTQRRIQEIKAAEEAAEAAQRQREAK